MSSRAQHFRQAERLLEQAQDLRDSIEQLLANAQTQIGVAGRTGMINSTGVIITSLTQEAAVRAQLAHTPDDVYEEYLDLISTEQLREEVVGMPDQGSRDWLKDED